MEYLDKNNSLDQQVILHDLQISNLQTFIITARTLSFANAADYLCLSPSAVSHRISKLETQLGFSLFKRLTRQIKLTPEGQQFYEVLKDSFDRIKREINYIKNNELYGLLHIFAHPSLAESWLIPHLSNFIKYCPNIELNISTSNEQIDFSKYPIDIALYYSNGSFSGVDSTKFMDEKIFPVCSREYAIKHNLINKPENLQHCTLLHDAKAWHYATAEAEWNVWTKHAQIPFPCLAKRIAFDTSKAANYAATCNLGVAMGRLNLVKNYLESGELIEPFPTPRAMAEYNYFAVWPKVKKISPLIQIFIDWLKEQGQEANY